jgi:NADH-quinone oxidoreductase subunit M
MSFPSAGGNGHPTAGKDQHEIPSPALEPITVPERIGAAILIGTTLLIGLYPRLLLDVIVPALNSPLFEAVRKQSGP